MDVLLYRQMRKQSQALKDVPDVALGHREIYVLCGIEQDAVADGDASGVRLGQAGNAIEQGCLARSGGAEQDGEARRRLEFNFQVELMGLRREALVESRVEQREGFPASFFGWPRLG